MSEEEEHDTAERQRPAESRRPAERRRPAGYYLKQDDERLAQFPKSIWASDYDPLNLYGMKCQAPLCPNYRVGYSKYCPKHKAQKRHYGSATQKNVLFGEVAPFIKKAERYYSRSLHTTDNARDRLWLSVEVRWNDCILTARRFLSAYTEGKADAATLKEMLPIQLPLTARLVDVEKAFRHLIGLSQYLPWTVIMFRTVGVYLFRDANPDRFEDEQCFRAILTSKAASLRGIKHGGKKMTTGGTLPLNVSIIIGSMLITCFGAVCHRMAQLEASRSEARTHPRSPAGAHSKNKKKRDSPESIAAYPSNLVKASATPQRSESPQGRRSEDQTSPQQSEDTLPQGATRMIKDNPNDD